MQGIVSALCLGSPVATTPYPRMLGAGCLCSRDIQRPCYYSRRFRHHNYSNDIERKRERTSRAQKTPSTCQFLKDRPGQSILKIKGGWGRGVLVTYDTVSWSFTDEGKSYQPTTRQPGQHNFVVQKSTVNSDHTIFKLPDGSKYALKVEILLGSQEKRCANFTLEDRWPWQRRKKKIKQSCGFVDELKRTS